MQGTYTHNILKDLLGDGIFTVDGDKWREQRKVSSYEFSTKVLRDFSSVIFRKNAVKLTHILSEAASNNQILDINVSPFLSLRPRDDKTDCTVCLSDIHFRPGLRLRLRLMSADKNSITLSCLKKKRGDYPSLITLF